MQLCQPGNILCGSIFQQVWPYQAGIMDQMCNANVSG